MALILDTAALDVADRADAVRAAMQYARVPALLTHNAAAHDVQARVELWRLGGGAEITLRSGTGIALSRTDRQISRDEAGDRLGVTLLARGRWSFHQRGVNRVVQAPGWDMILVDHAAPYEFARVGGSSMCAFNLDHAALGLPVPLIRRAAERLPASPLFMLVQDHVRALTSALGRTPAGPAQPMIGAATIDLVRALFATAGAGDVEYRPAADSAALLAQTRLYIQRHLADPALSPAGIARAHAISLRRLYQVWAGHEMSLAEFVMATRLDAARAELTGPAPIAVIAHRYGFGDLSHFARRFRRAYGMSPTEWRTISTEARTTRPPGGFRIS